jgi:hypothetical protein
MDVLRTNEKGDRFIFSVTIYPPLHLHTARVSFDYSVSFPQGRELRGF